MTVVEMGGIVLTLCLLQNNVALWVQSGGNYTVAVYILLLPLLLGVFLSLSNQCAVNTNLKTDFDSVYM